ncbi:DNA/RNA helicase domain-containing protein [Bacillus licheniformis]
MKPINLLSLIQAKNDLSEPVLKLYLNDFGIKVKSGELHDIESLIHEIQLLSVSPNIYDEFYVGFTINQISKEFDLLRFGEKHIINIELKRKTTEEKIKKQLIKNRYYLSFLEKKVFNFTYVVENNELFYLDENNTLTRSDFSFLVSKLEEQELKHIEDINKCFDPSNYLVSPFNSTEAFISGEYFLTDHQQYIKKKICELNAENKPCFISIQGSAGTGKTLLTYDIAKEYINTSKKVVIIHCGNLNSGHNKLSEDYSWEIAPIKYFSSYELSEYDLLIIDEVQRIRKDQLDKILVNIKGTNIKCIFSYDSQQCLSSNEIKRNIPEYISEQVSPELFELTDKIRTNKEIGSFIKKLFNPTKKDPIQDYSNIEVKYFSDVKVAREYVHDLKLYDNWKIINYTPSQYDYYPYEEYLIPCEDSAHDVIGQEFDNVIAFIDKHFYYKDNKLTTKGWGIKPYYHPTKMLFQVVTRARKKLCIIVLNNESVLKQCLNILQATE